MALRIFNIFQIYRAPECWGLFLGGMSFLGSFLVFFGYVFGFRVCF